MWLYENKAYEYDDQYFGYVYLIENLLTGRKYIGRKYFSKAGYKTVNKKRKKIRVESDWKDYYSSSPSLKKDVEEFGKDNFRRTILKLCKSRGGCNYYETKFILEHDAILDQNYYNDAVQCRIRSSHVKEDS